jgi:hypothetical protein
MGNSVSNKGILPGQIRTLGLDKETIALSVSLIGASEIISSDGCLSVKLAVQT